MQDKHFNQSSFVLSLIDFNYRNEHIYLKELVIFFTNNCCYNGYVMNLIECGKAGKCQMQNVSKKKCRQRETSTSENVEYYRKQNWTAIK